MSIRNAYALIPAIAFSTVTVAAMAAAQDAPAGRDAAAQKAAAPPAAPKDAATLLAAVRQAMGKELPSQVRLTASGSGYTPAADASAARQHYRIESYVLDLNTGSSIASERVVRLGEAAKDGKPQPETETREVSAGSPWTDQHVLWTTPLGFLAAAGTRPVTMRAETLFGTPYQVVTFTPAGGQPVHGYITSGNVLERTRTDVNKVPVESVFISWQEFGGVKFPSLIIQKENDQLARVLVVTAVEQTAPDAGTQSKQSD